MPVDVRAYRDGDAAAILDLFARSFHAPRTEAHFDWKYRRNPFGNERISLAFDDDRRLIGHYAAYPVPFRFRGAKLIGHQVGDTMTEKSVRHIGRGPTSVFGRTALHFYDSFCEGRVAFNYGFNVANVQKFSLRFLRSDRVEPVPYRLRGMQTLRPISRAERIARGYRLQLVREATPEFDELLERVANDYEFLVQRDARYLQWRHLDAPEGLSFVVAIRKWRRLAGWSAFRIRDNRLTWGDALFDRRWPDAPEVMLRHVAPQHGVNAIEGWFPPRPAWFAAILDNLGFAPLPEPQDLSLMCVPFTMPDAVDQMRESLYYTMADSDLF
jgi:GNAT acetyltransferase-like protein